MHKIVQIGTKRQKELIKNELTFFEKFLEVNKLDYLIYKIIIPKDFDDTVQRLTGNKHFKSVRREVGQIVMGKTIKKDEQFILVFPRYIFSEDFDNQIRFIYYLHELNHTIIKIQSPKKSNVDLRINELLNSLIFLYDEYYVNRKAIEVTNTLFESKSELFLKHIKEMPKSYIENLAKKGFYYRKIKRDILKFKLWLLSIDELISHIQPLIKSFSLYLLYFFSYYDNFESLIEFPRKLNSCKFYNNKTKELINYFRTKYRNDEFDLENDVNLIENYLFNFGLKLENTKEGLYYHVHFLIIDP